MIKITVDDLYIPHGSDERAYAETTELINLSFISHMVQMKGSMRLMDMTDIDMLYIPHGSDESRDNSINPFGESSFISHTVQMKESLRLKTLQKS